VETELGSGGSGYVYKAWHKRLRKQVVIKEYIYSSSGAIEMRRNEVEALKNIKNMHLPQVYDFFIETGRSFSILEYIEGESFDKLLAGGKKFAKPQINRWYCQLASALEAIHRKAICHRDIKPANIMLMPGEDVCLIDFDAAHVSGNSTKVISRSLGYASPEQYKYFQLCEKMYAGKTAEKENKYNETELMVDECAAYAIDWKLSDIYSLGATMYHLLTGNRPPVRASDTVEISVPADSSGGLAKIIERSMRINPNKRFSSAEELRECLNRITTL